MDENQAVSGQPACLLHMTSYYLWRDMALMHHFAHVKGSICLIHKSFEPSEPLISQACTCIVAQFHCVTMSFARIMFADP